MVREADVMAVIAIFGRIAGLAVPLAEKRRRGLDALCRFFKAHSWALEDTDALTGPPKAGANRLVATQDGRQLVIRRDNKGAAFGERERKLFEMVTTRIPWILEPEPVARTGTLRLSPRMQRVLVLVCLGGSRKGIADALRVQVGTVDGYVRDLYRVCGVRSQTELVRLYAGPELASVVGDHTEKGG